MILHDLVFTPDGHTQVGYDGGSCVFFNVTKPEENCTVTFSLPGGTITTQFLNSPPPAKTLAVTAQFSIANASLSITKEFAVVQFLQ